MSPPAQDGGRLRRTAEVATPSSSLALTTTSYPIEDRLASALAERRVDGWFWGHEHRCAIYEETEKVRYPACIGHGRVPVLVPTEDAPVPEGVRHEYRAADIVGDARWGLFGFVLLDFDGPRATVRHVNERGEEHSSDELAAERVGAPGAG